MAYRRVSSGSLLGGAVILVGIALLLSTTGVYDTGSLLQYLPSLFVFVGLYALVVSRFENLFGPVLVMIVAGTVQVVTLGVVEGATLWQFWPLLVVLFGVSVIAGRVRSRARATEDAYMDAFALFGGVERQVRSRTFRGATLTALFGGTELDLRDAVVTDPPARINATALFGGVEIIVPRNWNVEFDVLPVLGAATDERPRREAPDHEATDLVVTGFTAFGGVSLSD